MMLLAGGLFIASCSSQTGSKEIEVTTCSYAEKDGKQLSMDIYRLSSNSQSDVKRPTTRTCWRTLPERDTSAEAATTD